MTGPGTDGPEQEALLPLSDFVRQLRPMLDQPPKAHDGDPPLPPYACYYGSASRADVERGVAHTTPFHPRRWGARLPAEGCQPRFGSDTWAHLDPAHWQHGHGLTTLEALTGDRRLSNDSAFFEALAWWAPHATAVGRVLVGRRLLAFAASSRQPGPLAPSTKFVRRVWQGWYQAMGELLARHGLGWGDIEQRHLPVLRLGEAAAPPGSGPFVALGHSHDDAIARWESVISPIVERNQHQALTLGARSYFLPSSKGEVFAHWCSRLASMAYATRGSNRQTMRDWPSAWTERADRAEAEASAVAVPLRDFVPQRARSQRQRPDDLLAMLLAFAATRCLADMPEEERKTRRLAAYEGLTTMKHFPLVPSFDDSWRRVRAALDDLQLRTGPARGSIDSPSHPTRFAPAMFERVVLQALPLEPSDALIGTEDGMLALEVDLGDFRAWADGRAARQWFGGAACWPVYVEIWEGDGLSPTVWLGSANDAEDLPNGRHRLLVDWGDVDDGSPAARLQSGAVAPHTINAHAWLIDGAATGEVLQPTVYVRLRLPG